MEEVKPGVQNRISYIYVTNT